MQEFAPRGSFAAFVLFVLLALAALVQKPSHDEALLDYARLRDAGTGHAPGHDK